jgi:hypothetical protein
MGPLGRVLTLAGLACCLAVAPIAASAGGHRSREVTREFQREQSCPSSGRTTGACPGYVKDHIVPPACGGPEMRLATISLG